MSKKWEYLSKNLFYVKIKNKTYRYMFTAVHNGFIPKFNKCKKINFCKTRRTRMGHKMGRQKWDDKGNYKYNCYPVFGHPVHVFFEQLFHPVLVYAKKQALGPSLRREFTTVRYGLSLQKSFVTTYQGRAKISKMGEGDIINSFFQFLRMKKWQLDSRI